jgi:hypothetical protein
VWFPHHLSVRNPFFPSVTDVCDQKIDIFHRFGVSGVKQLLEDEVMQDARRALILARQAVYEAQLALERTEIRFQAAGIDPEVVVSQFEKQAGPAARQEYDRLVAAAMAELDESLRPQSQQRSADSTPSSPRRMRLHV